MSKCKPVLLAMNLLEPEHQLQIAEHFELVYAPEAHLLEPAFAAHGERVEVVLTIGATGLSAAQMQRLPRLRLVCALGAGFEAIDVAHAKAHGIAVANGVGTNDDCVADHALGLIIATLRGIPRLDRLTRQGVWRSAIGLPPGVSGKRLGILGLGTIGAKIARRAQAFDMPIGYCNRTPKAGVDFAYFADPVALAAWAEVLVVATPGGAATRHLVNAEVLQALGPQGVLINIARGSVVDTAALAAALRSGALGAAGLDVYESEPQPPAALLDLDNVVLTPHMGGWSPEAVQASVNRFLENARRHYAGEPMVSPL